MTGDKGKIISTPIDGLKLISIDVHRDERGWFKENWNSDRLESSGLSGFVPVQNNVAFNEAKGVTRGIHAEPWDKLISVAKGKVFGVWVDLRSGPSFGAVFSCEVDESLAVFVPKGVANGYQVLEDETVYSYLVTAHWSANAEYKFVNLFDPDLKIAWPIDRSKSIVSDKDISHPELKEVLAFETSTVVILGATGQLGRALTEVFPNAIKLGRQDFELGRDSLESNLEWENVDIVINAAAYTSVDTAETKVGFEEAWRTNVTGLALLADLCREKSKTLVHFSSDYVFSGAQNIPYDEEAVTSPLSLYGVSKAAGDLLVTALPKHYIFRTSWVFGEGQNFVNTMREKALQNESVRVVCDQEGRITRTEDLARAVSAVIDANAPFGVYNCTNSGPTSTWYDVACRVYEKLEKPRNLVTPILSEEFESERLQTGKLSARRPHQSQLNLSKIESVGVRMRDWREALDEFLVGDR